MAAIVKEIAGTYESRVDQIRALVTRMEAAWQGDAAGAAQRGAGPLATEHELAGLSLGTAQDLTNRQAGSFGEAKSRVVPVPPKPEPQNPMVVFTDPNAVLDHERQVDEHNAAAQNNVDVMTGYSGASEYNTTNLPTSYGKLTDDQAGVGVGSATDSSGEKTDSSGGPGGGNAGGDGREPGGGDRAPGGSPAGGPGQSAPTGPGGAAGGGGTDRTAVGGTTTPETFVPGPAGQTFVPADPGAGRVPGGAPATGGPVPGVVTGFGGSTGSGAGASPRGGSGPFGGAGPRGISTPGPGRGTAAEPFGSTARSAPAAGLTAAGRGTAASGVPLGGARGRDEEDTERKRPEWLEGGDPDELFDTDELTAPPTIGAEED